MRAHPGTAETAESVQMPVFPVKVGLGFFAIGIELVRREDWFLDDGERQDEDIFAAEIIDPAKSHYKDDWNLFRLREFFCRFELFRRREFKGDLLSHMGKPGKFDHELVTGRFMGYPVPGLLYRTCRTFLRRRIRQVPCSEQEKFPGELLYHRFFEAFFSPGMVIQESFHQCIKESHYGEMSIL